MKEFDFDKGHFIYKETEDGVITEFVLYNEEELRQLEARKIQLKIKKLKQKLADTDYQAIKYAEDLITDTEYEPIKTQRQSWRDEINQLEQQLALN